MIGQGMHVFNIWGQDADPIPIFGDGELLLDWTGATSRLEKSGEKFSLQLHFFREDFLEAVNRFYHNEDLTPVLEVKILVCSCSWERSMREIPKSDFCNHVLKRVWSDRSQSLFYFSGHPVPQAGSAAYREAVGREDDPAAHASGRHPGEPITHSSFHFLHFSPPAFIL